MVLQNVEEDVKSTIAYEGMYVTIIKNPNYLDSRIGIIEI